MSNLQLGDLVLLISPDRKRYLVRLEEDGTFHTHWGALPHRDLIGASPGTKAYSHRGDAFIVLRPSLEEILATMERATQIIFPKDIGYILLKLSVAPGARVIEAGSGSGGLTTALARYVWPDGQVYSYEKRPEFHQLAWENVGKAGLSKAVTFHLGDIGEGFAERDVDAVFYDMREPEAFLGQAAEALTPGGSFGCIVPTMNQVIRLLGGLERQPFADVEVAELLLRKYKAVRERVRPQDRMTAHTGFLVFARHLPRGLMVEPADGTDEEEREERG